MKLLRWLKDWTRSVFMRKHLEDDLRTELEFHLDMQTEYNLQRGMSRKAARRSAVREFGGVDKYTEICRDAWGARIIDDTIRDVSFGWRRILKNKGISILVILSIGLCFGFTLLMFTLLDSLHFNPKLYEDEDRIVRIADVFTNDAGGEENVFTSPGHYLERKRESSLLEEIGFYQGRWGTLCDLGPDPNPQYTFYYRITPSLLKVFGITPMMGRSITDADCISGTQTRCFTKLRILERAILRRSNDHGSTN